MGLGHDDPASYLGFGDFSGAKLAVKLWEGFFLCYFIIQKKDHPLSR